VRSGRLVVVLFGLFAIAAKTPVTWETATVVSQNIAPINMGAYAGPIGNGAIAVPLTGRANVVVIDTERFGYTLAEPDINSVRVFRRSYSTSPLILPVHGTVQFYRDGNWFIFIDNDGRKHRFPVIGIVQK
jgi:hypothetical protein